MSKDKSPSTVVDLTKCAQVEYEIRGGEYGVVSRSQTLTWGERVWLRETKYGVSFHQTEMSEAVGPL